MKVLHLFNEINFSGAELMYANAAYLFQSHGIKMLACSTGEAKGNFVSEFEKNNIKTYHFPIKSKNRFSLKTIRNYFDFYLFLKKERIDVLHIHRSDLFIIALCARLTKVRTIKTMHNVFRNRKITYIFGVSQRYFARKFLKVTFHTIGKSVYENELYYYKNPSVRINNWYDSNRFSPPKDENQRQNIRKTLGLNTNNFVIISVGGCSSIKNHSDIIKALSILKGQLNFIYLHLGTGKTEPQEQELAKELGLIDNIRFIGNVNNVQDFLIAADLYVMSSKFEGLSIAGIEAMACGKPSILYNSPGLRDLIENDNNGFLIEPDHKILAEKIMEFQQNPKFIELKGKAALDFVNRNHSLKDNVEKIISLYKSDR